MAIVETDLGWAAEEDYLVYDAGIWLADVNDRTFVKSYDGYAIGVTFKSTTTGWSGPLLISTESNSATYKYGNTQLGPNGTVTHFKRTWYYNTNHWYQNPSVFIPGVLPFYESASEGEKLVKEIMTAAGLRLYRTDKTWSFLAGLMCGLTGKSLPKIGV